MLRTIFIILVLNTNEKQRAAFIGTKNVNNATDNWNQGMRLKPSRSTSSPTTPSNSLARMNCRLQIFPSTWIVFPTPLLQFPSKSRLFTQPRISFVERKSLHSHLSIRSLKIVLNTYISSSIRPCCHSPPTVYESECAKRKSLKSIQLNVENFSANPSKYHSRGPWRLKSPGERSSKLYTVHKTEWNSKDGGRKIAFNHFSEGPGCRGKPCDLLIKAD